MHCFKFFMGESREIWTTSIVLPAKLLGCGPQSNFGYQDMKCCSISHYPFKLNVNLTDVNAATIGSKLMEDFQLTVGRWCFLTSYANAFRSYKQSDSILHGENDLFAGFPLRNIIYLMVGVCMTGTAIYKTTVNLQTNSCLSSPSSTIESATVVLMNVSVQISLRSNLTGSTMCLRRSISHLKLPVSFGCWLCSL